MEPQLNPRERLRKRNRLTGLVAAGVVFAMIGMAYAAVPLYSLFCQVTGYGGTTQTAEAAPVEIGERIITVRFNADTARGMPWQFQPRQRAVTLRVGEQSLAYFDATNPTDRAITGTATFNVTPPKAGVYFNKIECFCFTQQSLTAGQSAELPVSFFVDPAIAEDPQMDDVKTITLSYTFFEVPSGSEKIKTKKNIARNDVANRVAENGVK